MSGRADICVIFDLDGTLVDSEALGNQALLDLLPDLDERPESLVARYRGWKLAAILDDLAIRLGGPLPAGFEGRYRRRVAALFERELRPTPGAPEMLAGLALPRCVASSGPPEKIAQALRVSGLAPFFRGEHIFSSYQVGSWKPEPGLFLHAARAMGFVPSRCVVVEDSEVGLAAARAAGMRPLHYTQRPTSGAPGGGLSFGSMSELPALLAGLAAR